MCKEMILAVLIISIAFGTEPEFQTRIIQLSPSAYCAAVPRPVGICHMRTGLPSESCLARLFSWAEPSHIPAGKEENNKVQQRSRDGNAGRHAASNEIVQCHCRINQGHPLHFHRQDKEQQYFHVRIYRRKGEEDRHGNIVRTDQSHSGKGYFVPI